MLTKSKPKPKRKPKAERATTDRCAGLTDAQSRSLKELAQAARGVDDGWCHPKDIWPDVLQHDIRGLGLLVEKHLVEIQSTHSGVLYRVTPDGHARLPELLRLQTPLPASRAVPACPPALSFDPKRQPGRAIALRPAATAVDVASSGAEKLTSEEKRLLTQREKEIERSAHAFLDLGQALGEIQTKRLYRATHGTFEAYLAERWKLDRSMAYGYIAAAKIHVETSAIADKLHLQLVHESQYRELAKVKDPRDRENVLKRAARKIEFDADGDKWLTAKILAHARREELTDPDTLKQEAAEKKARAAAKPEAAATAEPAAVPPERPHGRTLDGCLDELRRWIREVVASCCPQEYDRFRLARALEAISKQALGIRACRVCGCSDFDRCQEAETGDFCSWIAVDLCSGCENGLPYETLRQKNGGQKNGSKFFLRSQEDHTQRRPNLRDADDRDRL